MELMIKYERILDYLETDIKYELSDIIDEIHEHCVKKYIRSLKYDVEVMSEKETIESDFEKVIEHTLNVMFSNIIEDFEIRIKSFRKKIKHKIKSRKPPLDPNVENINRSYNQNLNPGHRFGNRPL